MLEKDFEYYLNNRLDFLKKFKNSYVVIQNQNVLNALNSLEDAYNFILSGNQSGPFLIQEVKENEDSRTAMFNI